MGEFPGDEKATQPTLPGLEPEVETPEPKMVVRNPDMDDARRDSDKAQGVRN